jgi:hypothetical protein
MQRKNLAVIAILTLTISAIASLQVADLVSANYYPPPSIEIFSPISAPKVYNESSIQLYVRVNALPSESSSITYISYCLDGKDNVTLTELSRKDGEAYWTSTEGVIASGNAFSVKTNLNNIAEGNHTLIVYSHAADGTEMSRSREFTVDYDYVPPENPFGLPSNLPNGTSTPPFTTAHTPQPTINTGPSVNTGSLQPIENPLLILALASAVALVLLVVFVFRRKWGGAKTKQR